MAIPSLKPDQRYVNGQTQWFPSTLSKLPGDFNSSLVSHYERINVCCPISSVPSTHPAQWCRIRPQFQMCKSNAKAFGFILPRPPIAVLPAETWKEMEVSHNRYRKRKRKKNDWNKYSISQEKNKPENNWQFSMCIHFSSFPAYWIKIEPLSRGCLESLKWINYSRKGLGRRGTTEYFPQSYPEIKCELSVHGDCRQKIIL